MATKLEELIGFIKENKDNLKKLVDGGEEAIALLNGPHDELDKQLKRAKAFADALNDEFTAKPEDRTAGLTEQIKDLESQLDKEPNPVRRMVLNRHIAQLLELRGAEGLAADFSGIVLFPPAEVQSIQGLLTQAAQDIQLRHDIATAIRVTTSMITASAQIAGKVATSGLL
jgi:ABC-type transporter Mla subunit MlaD